ncbi:MAG: HEAT repeat domain-containing protein [Blastocatellia bacterium]
MTEQTINYAETPTTELIEFLIKEEDRVTLAHIHELAARPDAIEPLRDILRDDYYWHECEMDEAWVLYHAFTVLGLTRNPAYLPDLFDALKEAHETDFDYITELSPTVFAYFGAPAVGSLMQFINDLQSKHEESWVLTYPRSHAITGLTRIAFEHPPVRAKIADFVCALMTDQAETDSTFLSFICDEVLLLDREKGMAAVRAAYERNMIDKSINGDFSELIKLADSGKGEAEWQFTKDLFEFYRPEEIAKRQERWQREEEEENRQNEQRALAIQSSPFDSLPLPPRYDLPPTMPTGYHRTEEGNFIREEKIGRNDPCPCLSGKKYKKCCGK